MNDPVASKPRPDFEPSIFTSIRRRYFCRVEAKTHIGAHPETFNTEKIRWHDSKTFQARVSTYKHRLLALIFRIFLIVSLDQVLEVMAAQERLEADCMSAISCLKCGIVRLPSRVRTVW